MKQLGILVLAMYIFAITGIDIHKDIEHDDVYVISALQNSSCERIHPEHHCHDHESESDGHCSCRCIEDEHCCTDNFILLLTSADVDHSLSLPSFNPEGAGFVIFTEIPQQSTRAADFIPCESDSPPGKASIRKNCIMRV